MVNRLLRLTAAAALAAAVSLVPLMAAGPDASALQNDVPALSGVWKLNVEASTTPSGAEKPSACERPSRGGGGGGGGGGVSVGSADTGGSDMSTDRTVGGALSPAETARFCAMLNQAYAAPEMMGVQATKTDFQMMLNPETRYGFAHKTDNKSQSLVTPAGPGDYKVKWDKTKIVREMETPDSLKIVEEYVLSQDGQQLVVTLKASSRMQRVPDPKIRRVYDRQVQ